MDQLVKIVLSIIPGTGPEDVLLPLFNKVMTPGAEHEVTLDFANRIMEQYPQVSIIENIVDAVGGIIEASVEDNSEHTGTVIERADENDFTDIFEDDHHEDSESEED